MLKSHYNNIILNLSQINIHIERRFICYPRKSVTIYYPRKSVTMLFKNKLR